MKIPHDDLPLFPLQTVLFPQQRLPLQIFEPRYREMIDRCLRDDLGFGVVLIKEGVEVGGAAIPHTIGTIARIVDSARLDDGRMNIITAGVTRFVLQEYFNDRVYMTGRIRLLPDENVDIDQVAPIVRQIGQSFQKYVSAIENVNNPEPSEGERTLELPKDPSVLSYAIAASLPISVGDKQSLLEVQTTPARLRREIAIIERELRLLRLVTERNDQMRDVGAFSVN